MTAIEHQELKGITVKNLVVTIASTASIVASVMTTYFGLKTDIQEIKSSQETTSRINNIRIKVLEEEVTFLQKEIGGIRLSGTENVLEPKYSMVSKKPASYLISAIEKK